MQLLGLQEQAVNEDFIITFCHFKECFHMPYKTKAYVVKYGVECGV